MRVLLIFTFLALTLNLSAQKTYSESIPDSDATTFVLESFNINDFKQVDWKAVKETFDDKAQDAPISLYFKYNKPLAVGQSSVESFKFRYNGNVKDLDSLITLSKKSIIRLSTVKGQKF